MKRLASICLLTLCLSVPSFAGHVLPGGWCECGSATECPCGSAEEPHNATAPARPIQGADLGAETILILAALILVLRYKA